ncbi:MAG: T9SS type A sorting domain-containing protein [Bacteroidetes bacterium]|nr:T9SS type A sorting domain-containing protein [Bacteroidota bacterium]
MKKILPILFCILIFQASKAQSVLYYNFQNSLNEVNGAGPALTVLGNAGNFVIDTLSEIGGSNKTVYRFESNNGVQFNNVAAGNYIGKSYTIELYFVFDNLTSWKRVVDWKNRKTDWGAYVYDGKLNFYNLVTSAEAPVAEGEYTYYVITRDSTTNNVVIYTDAEAKVGFTDTYGDALIDGDGMLNFFYDDLVVPNEASSGAVATLKLYNHPLDSAAIVKNWNTIGSTVFGVGGTEIDNQAKLYPNPASTQITVDLTAFKNSDVNLIISDAKGKEEYKTDCRGGATNYVISTARFAPGIHVLRIICGEKQVSSKFMVR